MSVSIVYGQYVGVVTIVQTARHIGIVLSDPVRNTYTYSNFTPLYYSGNVKQEDTAMMLLSLAKGVLNIQ